MKHFDISDDEKETDDESDTCFWTKYSSFSRINITDITSNEKKLFSYGILANKG